jgi:nuclear RNA export factor
LKEFQELPPTQHASTAEPKKWMVESFPMAGLPDPSGQSKAGVNGLCLVVHGEFYENPQTAAKRRLRSFDRTFVLGPGGSNPEGVVIVSDLMTVRGYGGIKAFEPESSVPKSPEEEQAAMVAEVQRQTGMNAQYAAICLEQTNWQLEAALESFQQAKANIPPEAYVQ